MKQFKSLLQKINQELRLPQPEKSRILLEIAMDLEDTYAYYRERGHSEEEARVKAEEKIAFSQEAFTQIREVHKSPYVRWMNSFSERTRLRWEFILLLISTLLVSWFTIKLIYETPFFKEASVMVIPSVLVFLTVLILFSVKFYQLFIKKDHRIKTLNTLMPLLLFLTAFNLFLGMFGYVYELFIYSGKGFMVMSFLLITLTTNTPESFNIITQTADAILKSSSIALFSIFVTLVSASLWFILNNKILKIHQAEASVLVGN